MISSASATALDSILQQAVRTVMRGTMPADVAAERQLNVIERLLGRMPRNRGFRVHTDGSVSVYPASSRARLPAAKVEELSKDFHPRLKLLKIWS